MKQRAVHDLSHRCNDNDNDNDDDNDDDDDSSAAGQAHTATARTCEHVMHVYASVESVVNPLGQTAQSRPGRPAGVDVEYR